MTVDCPLTCYICGKTKEEWMTVDLIGCFKNQESASVRFEEKFGKEPDSFLFICNECSKIHSFRTKNAEKKYGVVGDEM